VRYSVIVKCWNPFFNRIFRRGNIHTGVTRIAGLR